MMDCLSNAVVVRVILQHFSNAELLKLSFVNKQWNYEARSIMKNRGNLTARLKFHDDQQCHEYLEAFAADLRRTNVVPFSGIRINLGHHSRACQIEALALTYSTILDRLPLKRISVELFGEWSNNKDCPGKFLVEAVMERFSDVLEQVSLAKHWPQLENLIVGFVKDRSFPNLKILNLGEIYERSDGTSLNLLRVLVARAPKLRELHTSGPINFMLNVLEGTSAVYVHQSVVSAPFDEIPDHCINALRLEKMRLHYRGANFNVERFNRITPMLLQASCKHLRSLDLDAFFAVPLICFGICFENVKYLTMKINYSQLERLEPRLFKIVNNFDFTRIFPNLVHVHIIAPCDNRELSVDHMNAFVEQANASLREPQPDRAINIKELDLCSISHDNAGFYAEMFPNIEQLLVSEDRGNVSFVSIWESYSNLKVLEVFADVHKHHFLDSVICGIFPEEVAELGQKDEEFLKKVNIVPIMPAITCLNLRTFVLLLGPFSTLSNWFQNPGDVKNPPSLNLTKVTGLVAFARCPDLVVKLLTCTPRDYESLQHMEPLVSVLA